MINEPCIVLKNKELAEGLFLLVLRAPNIASCVLPGQFVHMEVPSLQANILRRPFSIYDANLQEGTLEILYQVVGDGTSDISKWQPGYLTTIIGPIGKSWNIPSGVKNAILIGGGVGAAPLFMLYKQLVENNVFVDVVLGASTKDSLVTYDRYSNFCDAKPKCATDDGTFGTHGFCTTCVEELLDVNTYDYAAICGPEPMMHAASKLTCEKNIPTQVSLERLMACGIGACLSCVCEANGAKKRVCVDGPIFNVEDLGW